MIRSWRLFLVVVGLALLSACSFRFLYDHSDTIMLWRIDDFFDLSRDQRHLLRPRILTHVQWHRDNEVKAYIDFLHQVQLRVHKHLNAEDLPWFYDSLQPFYAHLARELVDDALRFFASVSPRQIDYLKAALEDENEEFVERVAMTVEQRNARKTKMVIEGLEKWTGDLDRSQRERIAAMVAQLPDVTADWLRYRRSRQQQFVDLVSGAAAGKDVREPLYEWTTRSRPDEFREFFAATDAMTLAIDKLLSDEQRQQVIDTIQKWIDDMQSVLRERSAPRSAVAGEH